MSHPHDRKWIAALLDAANMDKFNRMQLRDKYQEWFAVSRQCANIGIREYLVNHNWLTEKRIREITINARSNRSKKS